MYTEFPVKVRLGGDVLPHITGWVIGPCVNSDPDDFDVQMYWVEWDDDMLNPSREPFGKLVTMDTNR